MPRGLGKPSEYPKIQKRLDNNRISRYTVIEVGKIERA